MVQWPAALSYIIPGGLAPPISVTLAAMFFASKTWRILAFADATMTVITTVQVQF